MPKKNKIKKQFKNEEVKVFKQFKKQKILNQISFVLAALIVAVGINSFVLNWEYGDKLKTNLLEANKITKANIYVEKNNSTIKVKIWKNIDQVKNISFSLIYNPEEIKLKDIVSKIKWSTLTKLQNEKWIVTLIINFDKITHIKKWENIIDLYIDKKTANTTQNLNIINSNFTDITNTKYDLTTSWITF